MASTLSLATADPKTLIERIGIYLVKDAQKGNHFSDFYNSGYRTKTPSGLDFIAENSQKDQNIWQIITSVITYPRWGLLRLYTDILPSDYAWFFHNREAETIDTLILQLWTPNSICIHYEGSSLQFVNAEESSDWGLLRKHRSQMKIVGITERIESMPEGGYVIMDSRLGWTCLQGTVLNIGFVTEKEIGFWGQMELPDKEELKVKVAKLEAEGLRTNFKYVKPSSLP